MVDRRAWCEKVNLKIIYFFKKNYFYFSIKFSNTFMQEDNAIIELVNKYGIRKWTVIAQKMEDDFKLIGRSGK